MLLYSYLLMHGNPCLLRSHICASLRQLRLSICTAPLCLLVQLFSLHHSMSARYVLFDDWFVAGVMVCAAL